MIASECDDQLRNRLICNLLTCQLHSLTNLINKVRVVSLITHLDCLFYILGDLLLALM